MAGRSDRQSSQQFDDDDELDDWAGDTDEENDLISCPHCRSLVYEDSVRCPECGDYLIRSNRLPGWMIAVIVVLLATFVLAAIRF